MEQVVLLDEQGRSIGAVDKATVHQDRTPLHLAFSCYVFTSDGRLLLTMRARTKRTWPGMWTNSCCGHPRPGEPVAAAVTRRLSAELGLSVPAVDLVLPGFRYRSTTANEYSPVYRAVSDELPNPDPNEVGDFEWVDWPEAVYSVRAGDLAMSPWSRLQIAELSRLGDDPLRWPVADSAQLPTAARPSAA